MERNQPRKNRELTEYTWIIDPLDGTTNYLHGLPVFSISVALLHNGEPVLGIVDCPVLRERFTAVKGEGAFLNGNRIRVSDNGELKDSLLATGFPYHNFAEMQAYIDVFNTFHAKYPRTLDEWGLQQSIWLIPPADDSMHSLN